MQHIDEPLKRYDPVPYTNEVEETDDGEYVKYEDVKKFLEIIAQKVRLI